MGYPRLQYAWLRYPLNKKKKLFIEYKNYLPLKVIVIWFLNSYVNSELQVSKKS